MLKNNGFTLLEVLIALAVLAIALAAVLKTTQQQVENINYLRDQTIAHWVASNVLNDIRLREQRLSVGKTQGKVQMATRNWFWTVQVTDTIDKELHRLDVQVRTTESSDQEPLALLTGFIANPLSRTKRKEYWIVPQSSGLAVNKSIGYCQKILNPRGTIKSKLFHFFRKYG